MRRLPYPKRLALGVGLALLPAPLAAQERIEGRVLGGLDEQIEGAMVLLLDAERPVASTLSDADGRFAIDAPGPGRYRLRVDRIGYASTESEPFDVAAGEVVRRDARTAPEAVALEGLDVSGAPRCDLGAAEGSATAAVWEEARKALAAATWTADRELYRLSWIHYQRRLGPDARRVLSEERRRQRSVTPRPFRSVDQDTLLAFGYARDLGDGRVYWAPDADVLLSDAFLDGHCFSLDRREREGRTEIGLRFEPVEGVRLPDIVGTLWIDVTHGGLTTVEFEYVNVPRSARVVRGNARGRLQFQALPNGTWIIDEWWIRMPVLRERRDRIAGTVRYEVTGYAEEGARVTGIRSLSGAVVTTDREEAP